MSASENHIMIMSSYQIQVLFFASVFAPLPTGAGRFSLLFLYNRIFKSDCSFYVAVRFVGIVNGLSYVGCTLALGLHCLHMEKSWDPLIEGRCFHSKALVVFISILDSSLDLAVMILPISVLRRLQMSLRRRINVAMIFIFGGL